MIISAFGPTYASAINFFQNEASDDWPEVLTPTVAQVGASGAFDFAGDKPFPLQPVTVSKTFVITSSTWAGIETYLDLYKVLPSSGRDKLWGLCRDASRRWAWAKCTEINGPERTKQFLNYPLSLKFYLSEGVWYSEAVETHTVTAIGNMTVSNGTWFAYPKCTLTVSSGTLASFTLSDLSGRWSWIYAHPITAGQTVVVDSAAFLCTHTGVTNAYQYLTIPTGQFPWMWIVPGAMTFNLARSGSGAFSATYEHYKTYL